MSIRIRFVAASAGLVLLAGWVFAQSSQPDMPSVLQQLQDSLKRLQAEVKSLQETVKRQANEAKKSKSSPGSNVSGATAKSAVPVSQTPLQKAVEAYNRGRDLEGKNLLRAAIESYGEAILADPGNVSRAE